MCSASSFRLPARRSEYTGVGFFHILTFRLTPRPSIDTRVRIDAAATQWFADGGGFILFVNNESSRY